MSAWKSHAICLACLAKRHPEGRAPVRFLDDFAKSEPCCWCAAVTREGIYVREKSADVPCKGVCGQDAKPR